jgi:hypothetical protein
LFGVLNSDLRAELGTRNGVMHADVNISAAWVNVGCLSIFECLAEPIYIRRDSFWRGGVVVGRDLPEIKVLKDLSYDHFVLDESV